MEFWRDLVGKQVTVLLPRSRRAKEKERETLEREPYARAAEAVEGANTRAESVAGGDRGRTEAGRFVRELRGV